jgi:carbon monoxide dehydrogenase subunit G
MMRFEIRIPISVPPERVWTFLWDIHRLANCIPGCIGARVVAPGVRYEACIRERIGPFAVQFPLVIDVLEKEELRRLKAEATGRDATIGSSLKVMLDLALESLDGGSLLSITTHVDLGGKLRTLGGEVVERKAHDILNRFGDAVRRELEADAEEGG